MHVLSMSGSYCETANGSLNQLSSTCSYARLATWITVAIPGLIRAKGPDWAPRLDAGFHPGRDAFTRLQTEPGRAPPPRGGGGAPGAPPLGEPQ